MWLQRIKEINEGVHVKVTMYSVSNLVLSINEHLKLIKNLGFLGDDFSVRVDKEPLQFSGPMKYRISIDGPGRTEILGKEARLRDVSIRLEGVWAGLMIARRIITPNPQSKKENDSRTSNRLDSGGNRK